MFDIGWSELLVIGVVALIAIGPKELPGVLRAVGHWMGKIRRMASEFQGQFQEAMREAELADVKKQFDDMTSVTGDLTKFDPLADMQKDIERVGDAAVPAGSRHTDAAAGRAGARSRARNFGAAAGAAVSGHQCRLCAAGKRSRSEA